MRQPVDEAQNYVRAHGGDFAVIENPPGIFPARELVPLAPINSEAFDRPAAIFLDMDGTVTCTEPLFLHGVEAVVRRATGWHDKTDWAGLDPERDHPRIVGYSTLRNLEYLFGMVSDGVKARLFFAAVDDALYFLTHHPLPGDLQRRIQVLLENYGLEAWWADASERTPFTESTGRMVDGCVRRFPDVDCAAFSQFGLLIFYADYLDALEKVNRGEGALVSEMLYGNSTTPAVGPMPGIALLCALVKGLVPVAAAEKIVAQHGRDGDGIARLTRLCERFANAPIPVALVTSSGAHETGLVLRAVFRAMREEVAAWGLSHEEGARIVEAFAGPESYFDAMVTCDDVIEGRTKPFRDPYTLALDRLDLHGEAASRVIGFEDTEAGIIAQRGAGVGVPCALPIEFTAHQDFSAAAHVIPDGVLEVMLTHGLFLR